MPPDPDCVFCRILAGAIPSFRIDEDAQTVAFLDINPVQPGHVLVATRAHAADLHAADDHALAAVLPAARRVATAIRAALAPDGISLLQANGPGAAQSVRHFHLHVIPRRLGDGLVRNWEPRPGDKRELAAMAEKLRAAIGRAS
jgi:histidine triad (HIT) family protein